MKRLLGLVLLTTVSCLVLSGCSTVSYEEWKTNRDPDNMASTWDRNVEYGTLYVTSFPEGADVEYFNANGEWVTVASTKDGARLSLEATGREHLVRVTKFGFIPEYRSVALLPNNKSQTLTIYMRRNDHSLDSMVSE